MGDSVFAKRESMCVFVCALWDVEESSNSWRKSGQLIPCLPASVPRSQQLSVEKLFARSDFITLHTPLTPETRGLIGRANLEKCKKGVRIVNCARGGIVDPLALLEAIKIGKVCLVSR